MCAAISFYSKFPVFAVLIHAMTDWLTAIALSLFNSALILLTPNIPDFLSLFQRLNTCFPGKTIVLELTTLLTSTHRVFVNCLSGVEHGNVTVVVSFVFRLGFLLFSRTIGFYASSLAAKIDRFRQYLLSPF